MSVYTANVCVSYISACVVSCVGVACVLGRAILGAGGGRDGGRRRGGRAALWADWSLRIADVKLSTGSVRTCLGRRYLRRRCATYVAEALTRGLWWVLAFWKKRAEISFM